MDKSLLPFLDRLFAADGSGHSKGKIARLEYELSVLRTEKKLVEQSKATAVARYEELLTRKNDELAQLQNNFDFVYNQRKELQLKIKNQADITGKSQADLNQNVLALRSENLTLKSKLDKYERQYQTMAAKCEHLRTDFNRELAANDQYRERVAALMEEKTKLAEANERLLQQSLALAKKGEEHQSHESLTELRTRFVTLQEKNRALQLKLDQVALHNVSVELLKQKNASLASEADTARGLRERNSVLELEVVKLRAKFDEYFGLIEASVSDGQSSKEVMVKDFITSYQNLRNKNLTLYEKLSECQAELSSCQQSHDVLISKIEQEYVPQITNLTTLNEAQALQIKELTNASTLAGKEIEFLRKSLKDLDEVASYRNSNSPDKTESKETMTQYLSNLEKLVDDYKQEIDRLRKQAHLEPTPLVPSKRPRLIAEDDSRIRTINKLRNENLQLLAEAKTLRSEIEILKQNLKKLDESTQERSAHTLELRNNLFQADQYVKQEQLDALRKENLALITKYINETDVQEVPRAIFVRQECDKDMLQAKIDKLVKKENRLRTVFAEKSKEIIAVISRYFGYSIEFIPSTINPNDLCSKIKLVLRYMSKDATGKASPSIIVDVHTKALKAKGDDEFKSLCEELVGQWVSEKNQIPCFLSALNLRLFNKEVLESQSL